MELRERLIGICCVGCQVRTCSANRIEELEREQRQRTAENERLRKVNTAPNHVHSDDSGVFWEGPEKDCPICNPSPHLWTDSNGVGWSHSGEARDCPICNPEHYIREMDSNLVVICQPVLVAKYFKEKPCQL